jgi:hypothetical protein
MEKKGKTIGDEPEMISSPVSLFFCYWGGNREADEVALRKSYYGGSVPVPVTGPTMASGKKRSG